MTTSTPSPATTGRARVLAAAAEHGWTVQEFGITSAWIGTGRAQILVEFSVRGAVTYASGPSWRAIGADKAGRVIRALAS